MALMRAVRFLGDEFCTTRSTATTATACGWFDAMAAWSDEDCVL